MAPPIFKQWLQPLVNRMVAISPTLFKRALAQLNPDAVVDEVSRWDKQSYDQFVSTGTLDGFEDIVTLFGIGRFNRALIRLELDEASLLYRIVRSLTAPTGVEVGRGWGGSTILLATAVGQKGRVFSIDINPTHDEEVAGILESGQIRDRVELRVGDSNEVEVDVDGDLDFAFIDGCHQYEAAKRDHLRWGGRVREGGYIIHHDMTQTRPNASASEQTLKLRDDILTRQRDCIEAHGEAGSLIVFRKTRPDWIAF